MKTDLNKLNIGELHKVRELLDMTTLNELMKKFQSLDQEDFDEMLRIICFMVLAFRQRTNPEATLESAVDEVHELSLDEVPKAVNILLNGATDPTPEPTGSRVSKRTKS